MRVYSIDEYMKKSKGMHIGKRDHDTPFNEKQHKHEFIEIVYIMSGKMTHEINSKTCNVKHGDIIFMNYGCTHSFHAEAPHCYVDILFSPEMFEESVLTPQNAFAVLALTAFDGMREDTDFGKISFSGSERHDIENIIMAMLKEYNEQQDSWELILGNYLHTLIIKMLRKSNANMAYVNLDETWKEILSYIDENIDSKLSLSELARKCFYNPSYFSRVFKEKFGVTFIEYVAKKRLDCAIDLMQNSQMSLEDIACQAGFSDIKGLYHAFSRYLNMSPSEYRKNKM